MVSSTPNGRTTFITNGCSIPNKHNYDGTSNGIGGGNRQTHNVKNVLEEDYKFHLMTKFTSENHHPYIQKNTSNSDGYGLMALV